MERGIIGFILIAIVIAIVVTHNRPAPKIDGASPATTTFPRLHLFRGDSDADKSLDLKIDTERLPASGTVRLLERDGLFYDPDGSPIHTTVTNDIYFLKTHYDFGTFAGYRPASRGQEGLDPFTAGVRFSPLRLCYDTIAPDLAITNQWAGAGASFYLPENFVGPTWKHLGLGVWYGYPYRGRSDAPGGWTAGLSFSIR